MPGFADLPARIEALAREHERLAVVLLDAFGWAFVQRHADLLRALPKWTLQLLVPAHLSESTEAFLAAARQELAAPLRASVVEELRWYFNERQRITVADDSARSVDPARYQRVRRAFGAPRYRVLYRTWTRVGDRAVNGLQSRVLAVALERRTGRGKDAVDHAPGAHDDVANAVAGALGQRTFTVPRIRRFGQPAPAGWYA